MRGVLTADWGAQGPINMFVVGSGASAHHFAYKALTRNKNEFAYEALHNMESMQSVLNIKF